MTDRPDTAPTPPKAATSPSRDRLATALKANMARRKAQAKARGASGTATAGAGEPPGAPTTNHE